MHNFKIRLSNFCKIYLKFVNIILDQNLIKICKMIKIKVGEKLKKIKYKINNRINKYNYKINNNKKKKKNVRKMKFYG